MDIRDITDIRYALIGEEYRPIRMREIDPEEWIPKSHITLPTTFYEKTGALDNPIYVNRGVFIYNPENGMLREVREMVQEEQINRFIKNTKKSAKKSAKKSVKKTKSIDISDELLNAFSKRVQLCNKIKDLNALKLDISKYYSLYKNLNKSSKLLESFFKRIQRCNRIEDLNRIKLDLSAYDTLRDLRRFKVI